MINLRIAIDSRKKNKRTSCSSNDKTCFHKDFHEFVTSGSNTKKHKNKSPTHFFSVNCIWDLTNSRYFCRQSKLFSLRLQPLTATLNHLTRFFFLGLAETTARSGDQSLTGWVTWLQRPSCCSGKPESMCRTLLSLNSISEVSSRAEPSSRSLEEPKQDLWVTVCVCL